MGILGAGAIGELHARVVAEDPSSVLVAVCDLSEDARRILAERYGAASVAEWDDFFDQVEVAVIAVPHHLHRAAVEAAARHGVDVLVEKPLALDDGECIAIDAAVRLAGIRLMVGHPMRFSSAFIQARELISSGRHGDVRSVLTRLVVPWGTNRAAWQDDPRTGGALLMWGSHAVDRICWLARSRVSAVSGAVRRELHDGAGADDSVDALLYLESGAVATLHLVGFEFGASDVDTEVVLEGGMVRVSSRGRLGLAQSGDWSELPLQDDAAWPEGALRRQWSAFQIWRSGGGDPPVEFDEARHVVQVLEAIRRSAALDQTVRVSDVTR